MGFLSVLASWLRRGWQAYERVDEALYPIIGLRSYDKYVEHFKKSHPDKEPMSKAEFFRQAQDDKEKNVKC